MHRRLVVDVIVHPEYRVGYEQIDDTTYVHVNVRKWNSRIARQFRKEIQEAQCLLGRPVYVVDDPDVPNLVKFLTHYDFKHCGYTQDIKGRSVALYERSLD